ncbi:MAG TPA: hypothetical protein VIO87_07700 [Methylotenera sp.]|jgi:hypothetical protein
MHVSERLRLDSKRNISLKLNILESWLEVNKIPDQIDENGQVMRDSEGEVKIEWFPKSIYQFSKWDGSQNSYGGLTLLTKQWGKFKSLGRSTLDLYPDLKVEIQMVIDSLLKIESIQYISTNKYNKIKELEDKLRLEMAKKEITQTRYLNLLNENIELNDALKREKIAHQNNVIMLTEKLSIIEERAAELTKALTNIRSIKSL